LTVGGALEALREADDLSQVEMARRLGVTRQHLCDIEKGRRLVSPGRAAGFARKLRHSQALFIRLAVQDQLSSEGIEARVTVDVA
jgi:transcriptional regulator with XRE-family HTH domain